jgi:hypothetical protein
MALGQTREVPSQATPISGAPEYLRFEKNIFRPETISSQFPLRLPRIAAPIRSATWSEGETSKALDVSPEISHWIISSKDPLSKSGLVTIEFDAPPLLVDELTPIQAAADGSFWLPAHSATTVGDKLRYEPQPHKNTVGYWTQSKDKALWNFQLDKPGKFNVAILQGCGKGQGGSIATLTIRQLGIPLDTNSQAQDFEVLETGHFQNFQWKQLQSVELRHPATYILEVAPKEIRKNALMDIRAIQLIRLPE